MFRKSENGPVSYTHLDVYKRQGNGIRCGAGGPAGDIVQGAGEAVDVDEEGRLVVRTDSGEVHVFTGEVRCV